MIPRVDSKKTVRASLLPNIKRFLNLLYPGFMNGHANKIKSSKRPLDSDFFTAPIPVTPLTPTLEQVRGPPVLKKVHAPLQTRPVYLSDRDNSNTLNSPAPRGNYNSSKIRQIFKQIIESHPLSPTSGSNPPPQQPKLRPQIGLPKLSFRKDHEPAITRPTLNLKPDSSKREEDTTPRTGVKYVNKDQGSYSGQTPNGILNLLPQSQESRRRNRLSNPVAKPKNHQLEITHHISDLKINPNEHEEDVSVLSHKKVVAENKDEASQFCRSPRQKKLKSKFKPNDISKTTCKKVIIKNQDDTVVPTEDQVIVLWDLDNKQSGVHYDVAISLRKIAGLFGKLINISAFGCETTFSQNVSRSFRYKRLEFLEDKHNIKPVERANESVRWNEVRKFLGVSEGQTLCSESIPEGISPESELRRAGVNVKRVESAPQAADKALRLAWMENRLLKDKSGLPTWLILVSDDTGFKNIFKMAREKGFGTVTVSSVTTELAMAGDLRIPWNEVIKGNHHFEGLADHIVDFSALGRKWLRNNMNQGEVCDDNATEEEVVREEMQLKRYKTWTQDQILMSNEKILKLEMRIEGNAYHNEGNAYHNEGNAYRNEDYVRWAQEKIAALKRFQERISTDLGPKLLKLEKALRKRSKKKKKSLNEQQTSLADTSDEDFLRNLSHSDFMEGLMRLATPSRSNTRRRRRCKERKAKKDSCIPHEQLNLLSKNQKYLYKKKLWILKRIKEGRLTPQELLLDKKHRRCDRYNERAIYKWKLQVQENFKGGRFSPEELELELISSTKKHFDIPDPNVLSRSTFVKIQDIQTTTTSGP